MERGWDPQVKRYFRKILNSISLGLIWIMATATAGIYFGLGSPAGRPLFHTIIFYAFAVFTLILLLNYLYKTWKNG
jgi:hypothetical protein